MSGKNVLCWSRAVLMKSPVSPIAVIMFAFVLRTLFHDEPVLADAGCPAPSFAVGFNLSAFDVGVSPQCVAVGDFNGDGKSDLAVANQDDLTILLGHGDGTFQAAVHYAAGNHPYSVAIGDFNGDGKSDVALAES